MSGEAEEPAPARPGAPAGGSVALRAFPAPLPLWRRLPRLALRGPILIYRYTLSAVMGRQCRYLPTCSEYADEAISRHGAWPGGWMAAARLCRCNPWGGHGFDPVPDQVPRAGRWYAPWRYGIWRAPGAGGADAGCTARRLTARGRCRCARAWQGRSRPR